MAYDEGGWVPGFLTHEQWQLIADATFDDPGASHWGSANLEPCPECPHEEQE